MSGKSPSRGPFHKQHGKRAKALLQPGRPQLYIIDWLLWKEFSWKKSILVLCKILRLFVNTLTADDKYFLVNRNKLTQPIQILLSSKQKTFSEDFSAFLKSTFNFEHFQKNMTVIGDVFPKLRTSKKVIRWMYEKSRFRRAFHKEQGKQAQTQLQSGRRHLYHIYWSMWT